MIKKEITIGEFKNVTSCFNILILEVITTAEIKHVTPRTDMMDILNLLPITCCKHRLLKKIYMEVFTKESIVSKTM